MGKIEVGDVVTLRSGGIRMTAMRPPDEKGEILVAYTASGESGLGGYGLFGGGETVKQMVIPVACLVIVDKRVKSEEKGVSGQ